MIVEIVQLRVDAVPDTCAFGDVVRPEVVLSAEGPTGVDDPRIPTSNALDRDQALGHVGLDPKPSPRASALDASCSLGREQHEWRTGHAGGRSIAKR